MKNKKITKTVSFNMVFFIILIFFFTKICPVIPFDGDDWYFTGSMRVPLPIWKIFNPIKVLPEILEPIGGLIGAYLVYPITNDYVGAISITQAIIISFFVVTLFYGFNDFVRKKYNKNEKECLIYEFIFAISFFFIFKRIGGKSYYGFWATDLNCYFNYIIPGILNASLVLMIAKYENFIEIFNSWNYYKKGFFIVGIYFSIFSSIQLSIILSGYCSWIIIREISKLIKEKETKKIISVSKKNALFFIIDFLWLISLIFESSGTRATVISSDKWLTKQNLFDVARNFVYLYRQTNKLYIIIVLFLIAILLFYLFRKQKGVYRFVLETIYLLGITFIYLFVLYMKAGANYACRPDATWAIIFYIILYSNMCLILVSDFMPYLKSIFPLAITIVCLMTISMNYRFEQSVIDFNTAKEIDETIINQIVEADKKGEKYVEVQVPDYYNSDTNWPQPYNMAVWMQNTLYSHNIIKNRMKIVFVKNKLLYDKFYKDNESDEEPYFDFERGIYLKD